MKRVLPWIALLVAALATPALWATVQQVPSNTWAATGNLIGARAGAASALLYNGQVLITGGVNSAGVVTATAECYNPSTGTFLATASMQTPRVNHTASLLPDGRVLGVCAAERQPVMDRQT